MKKVFSVLLSVILFAALFLPAMTANAAGLTPVVYFHGDESIFKYHEDGSRTALFDDGDYLSAVVSDALPLAAKAVFSGDWTEYTDKVLEIVTPAFRDFAPAPDGTLPENTRIDILWDPATLRPEYYLYDGRPVYMYHSDFRKSPMDIADDAERYVETVKAKTGASKVILWGRCGGASLMAAYLAKYAAPENYADIENVCFINSSAMGTDYAEALLSGNVKIPAEAGYRFVRNLQNYEIEGLGSIDGEVMHFLQTTGEMLHETYGIVLTVELVQKLYESLKDTLIAPIIRGYWGICPSYVASTVNVNYEDYKDYIFPTAEDKALYAPIIAKLDDFHYNVQVKLPEAIGTMKNNGVAVNVFVEYGSQQYPLNENSEYVGDYMLSVEDQSFGATTAKVNETLSENYIKAQEEKELGKYISPDKQIDASTALLPDNTWFIKNLIHAFPYQLDNLLADVIRTPGNTVDTVEGYPQFLNYNKDVSRFLPQEEQNENDAQWENPDPGSGTRDFISIIRGILEKVVAFFRGIIEGIIGHAKGVVPPVE